MFDTMASLALSDLFERFADLRIVSIELGGGWVPNLVKRVGGAARSAFADWPNGKPEADPSDLIRRHLYVAPYPEDPFAEIVEVMGTDHVLLGSDWPHPEGLVQPGDLFDELGDLDDAVVRAIMRDNTAELLGIPAVA